MEKPAALPLDIQDEILGHLHDSPLTLAACALVCRRWLRQSRHCFFSGLTVHFDLSLYEEGFELLHKILFQDPVDTEKCSFWPHIIDLKMSDGYSRDEETTPWFIHIFSSTLPLASNLRTLRLNKQWFKVIPKKIISAISSHSNISSLHLSYITFNTHDQLLTLLSSVQNLSGTCSMENIVFEDSEDLEELDCQPATAVFSPIPSLQFHIKVKDASELYEFGPLILDHAWNITSFNALYLRLGPHSTGHFGEVIRHIGPSLEELCINLDNPDEPYPISFERNTSLRRLSVGKIAAFVKGTTSYPSTGIISALSTVRSREKFERLEGSIDYFIPPEEEEGNTNSGQSAENNTGVAGAGSAVVDYTSRLAAVKSYAWQSIEEIMMDKARFPGRGPTFYLGLTSELYHEQVTELIKTTCIPKLAQGGNLRMKKYISLYM